MSWKLGKGIPLFPLGAWHSPVQGAAQTPQCVPLPLLLWCPSPASTLAVPKETNAAPR